MQALQTERMFSANAQNCLVGLSTDAVEPANPHSCLSTGSGQRIQKFTPISKSRQKRLSKARETALQMPFFACKKIRCHSHEEVSIKNTSRCASHYAVAPSLSLACALPVMPQATTGSGNGLGSTSQTTTDTDTGDRVRVNP